MPVFFGAVLDSELPVMACSAGAHPQLGVVDMRSTWTVGQGVNVERVTPDDPRAQAADTGATFVAALRQGDRAARARFFDTHARRVRRVLIRVLGADNEVTDLVQEVFLRALRGVERYRGDADGLGPWLDRVAIFTARGVIRKRQVRRRLTPLAAPRDHEGAPAPDSSDSRETVRRVFAVLDRLPDEERIALSLRWLEQMELREVADACDVSLSTAKRRVRRGRKRFDEMAAQDPLLAAMLGGANA